MSIVDYLTGIRIDAARGLLAGSNRTIREISRAVGYGDANYFFPHIPARNRTDPQGVPSLPAAMIEISLFAGIVLNMAGKNPSYTGIIDTYSREVSMFKKDFNCCSCSGSSGRERFLPRVHRSRQLQSPQKKLNRLFSGLQRPMPRIIPQPKATSTLRIW